MSFIYVGGRDDDGVDERRRQYRDRQHSCHAEEENGGGSYAIPDLSQPLERAVESRDGRV